MRPQAGCKRIQYSVLNTGGIQGIYRGYTGGKAPAWEVIATTKPPQGLLIANRFRPRSHSKAPPKLPQSQGTARESGCCEQAQARKSSNIAVGWRKVGVGKQSTCYSRAIERLDLVAADPRPGVLRTSLLFSAPLHPDLLAGGEDLTQRRRDSQSGRAAT